MFNGIPGTSIVSSGRESSLKLKTLKAVLHRMRGEQVANEKTFVTDKKNTKKSSNAKTGKTFCMQLMC